MSECRKCGIELNDDNWHPSQRKLSQQICKSCNSKQTRSWYNANPEKARILREKDSRNRGHKSFHENRNCPAFLGVHVAERVLSHVFKDVERMPLKNTGYDFICNKGKKIDVKSACMGSHEQWVFHIRHNTTADYFLCLAFDNREELNPLHIWLLPGTAINYRISASVCLNTISKWDEYRLDISKVTSCCNILKGVV